LTTLAGARVTLRPAAAADLSVLHALWTDPSIRRYLFDDRSLDESEAAAFLAASEAAFARHGYGLWLAGAAGAAAAIGFAGLLEAPDEGPPNLVFGLAPEHWGRGLARESALLVLGQAFGALGLGELRADVDEPNVASVRLLERLGFTRERRALVEGRPFLYYRLSRDRWTG
jgi:[ribosomal protein S5]-alanine N-acetyltransferase